MNKIILLVVGLIVLGGLLLMVNNQAKNQNQNINPNTAVPTITKASQPTTTTQAPSGVMAKEVTVTLTSADFQPKSLTIKAGTKVIWINKSGDVATVHSAVHPTHLVYPPLNLGEIPNNGSVSLIFDKPGTYNYHNHYNPSQNGVVTVE